MKRFTMVMALASVALLGENAAAQALGNSLYTQTQLKSIENQNSAANYTSDRIRSNLYNRSVPQYAFSTVNRGLYSSAIAGGQRQKPFSSISNGPSVTPYLALSSPFSSTATNYYTQVRPMIEQQKVNQQMQAQNQRMQRQLSSIFAQAPYDPQGSEMRAPTGHAAVFMNYGGYYPVSPVPQQQRR